MKPRKPKPVLFGNIEQEEAHYAEFKKRFAELRAKLKGLLVDAEAANDTQNVWYCKKSLAQLDAQEANLRKPGEPRRKI